MVEGTCPGSSVRMLLAAGALSVPLSAPALAVVGPSTEAQDLAPYVVMVLQRSGAVAGFCSGVVVAPNVVLTAAHCAPAGAELRIHFKNPDGKPVLLPVAKVVSHPGYRADAIKMRRRSVDLALLRLADPLPERFRPAAFGFVNATTTGTAFRVAGFGVTRENDAASSGTLRTVRLEARDPPSSLLLWARDPDQRGAGACTGDSGGPVFGAASDTVEAVTLWAAGEGEAACGALTQALWLGPERGWIDRVLSGWSAGR